MLGGPSCELTAVFQGSPPVQSDLHAGSRVILHQGHPSLNSGLSGFSLTRQGKPPLDVSSPGRKLSPEVKGSEAVS